MAVIRVELLGGLGNQLFQAAAGFALAQRTGAALEFDISRFRAAGSRAYGLEGLRHGARLVGGAREGAGRLINRVGRALSFGRAKAPIGWQGGAFRERDYAYDPRFESLAAPCYLSGYFHSEKYFAPAAEQIREAFSLEPQLGEEARAFAAAMAPESLAVHLRVGDFKAAQHFNAVHGTLGMAYYRNAIALARAARPIDEIYVFTDTPEAIPALIPPGTPYRAVTGHTAPEDLYLMSRARAHIIANSTFSWWSAWFDPRPDKLVIAPRAWLAPEALRKTYIGDLYPEGWVML
ncbi:MAG: alpha-1,2-fucosyltransferase [Beijerinckiaceae bacterium]|jgi:hypothetical protein|nr:alpha-1,2-fucosyltransferase [Beijerinckiaceae bacterium]